MLVELQGKDGLNVSRENPSSVTCITLKTTSDDNVLKSKGSHSVSSHLRTVLLHK